MTDFLTDPTLRTVALGTAALGATAGLVGAFAVARRESLQGDAVSHAALPGLAAAFALGGRSPLAVLLGGAAAGWCALALVGLLTRRRVPFDAALGGVLSVFFGLGLAAQTYLTRSSPEAARFGFERYLFGQAALLREADVILIAAVGLGVLLVLLALWKELAAVSFDPEFAAAAGLPVRALNLLLAGLVVAAVVAGLQSVGVVLMSALLIAPAVAARQWSDRLGRVAAISAAVGAAAGLGGTYFGTLTAAEGLRVPTGPLIVLAATAAAAVSLLVAPRRGLVWRGFRP